MSLLLGNLRELIGDLSDPGDPGDVTASVTATLTVEIEDDEDLPGR